MKFPKIAALVLGLGSLGLISCSSDSKNNAAGAVTADASKNETGTDAGVTGDGGTGDTAPMITEKDVHLRLINATPAAGVTVGDPGTFTSKYNAGMCN